ncbi:MAG: M24 family metallopeptidase [Actinomycetota bacterium]|jgi:Xaa-Pro aminopeptidase|nr:M24 family metallopeptidase [Actinomycetota bacterium]
MSLQPSETEVDRRHQSMRAAMARSDLDALIVCGSEYTGFEGAVRYASGFRIVHRYAYVLLPIEGSPLTVFPAEARYVGEHDDGFVKEHVFAELPGQWMAEHLRSSGCHRVGVYGLDYVMCVRDYRALESSGLEIVGFDEQFDLARAVKSAEELEMVRETMAINEAGFWAVHAAYRPGRTQAELMAEAEATFTRAGCGRLTMDMTLYGAHGAATPEFRIPDHVNPIVPDDLLLYSLEVAGPSGYWVEFTRALSKGPLAKDTEVLLEAYAESFEATPSALRAGMTAHDAHGVVSEPFRRRGLRLGHVTGHSIGMTMIEHPRIGDGVDVELVEDMVISMHPHAISADGRSCMYMQDTWRIAAGKAELLSLVPLQVFDGSESRTQGAT